MAKYKFAVMLTETIHRTQEVEVEGEDLFEAQDKMNSLVVKMEKEGPVLHHSFVVDGVDYGDIFQWKEEQLTWEECKALFSSGPFGDDPTEAPGWRIEFIARLTPEQAAEEEREQQEIRKRTKDIREAFLKRLSGEQ